MEESKQKLIYPDFRDRCDFQTTLEISNQLTDAASKSFLPEQYLSKYSEKFESLDVDHFRISLYGLKFLLNRWHEKSSFNSGEHKLFTSISRNPDVPLPLNESSNDMSVLIPYNFNFSFNPSFLKKITPLHDWVRYYAIENIEQLMRKKWSFKSCLAEKCENYVASKVRFCGESCLSKTQKRRTHGKQSTFRSNTDKLSGKKTLISRRR